MKFSNKKCAFLFPGQGAQYPGMGKDFYDRYAVARETFQEADQLLGIPLTKMIFEGTPEQLMLTKNSQVAIYVTCCAMVRVIRQEMPDLEPSICAGLSLGEYTALFASDRLSFAEGLQLVRARAQWMHEACFAHPGTMRVVLGLGEDKIGPLLPPNCWIANLNCPGQVVIAGLTTAVEQVTPRLIEAGAKRVLPLEVSGAFHTPLMQDARVRLEPEIRAAAFQDSSIQLVMNVPGDFVHSLEQVKQYLIQQVTSPTRWEKGIRAMADSGVEVFIEIGCGKTLTGMNKKIGFGANSFSIETVQDLEGIYATAER